MEGMTFNELVERMGQKQAFVHEFDEDGNFLIYFEDGGRARLQSYEIEDATKKIKRICDVLGKIDESD